MSREADASLEPENFPVSVFQKPNTYILPAVL